MNLFILITVIAILGGILILGGRRMARELKGIELATVSGALVAVTVVGRYLLYLLLAVPVMLVVHYIEWRELPNPSDPWYEHPFELRFENNQFPLHSEEFATPDVTAITDITGTVHFGQLPGFAYVIFLLTLLLSVAFAYQFLRHAESVLRSLHNRTPFVAGNDLIMKKVAGYWLGMVFIGSLGEAVLGWYLARHFTIEGITLYPTEVSILGPLIVAGAFFVVAEVFRVGRELKEENELTV